MMTRRGGQKTAVVAAGLGVGVVESDAITALAGIIINNGWKKGLADKLGVATS